MNRLRSALAPLRHRNFRLLDAIVGPLADAIGIDETLWICAGIVFVAITAQLLSRQVRELPRLPPEPVLVPQS